MRGYNLFVIALVPIVILMIYPGIDYSIGFGWHTEILNQKSLETYILFGLVVFIIVTYWVINRGQINTKDILTISHFLLTVIPIYWFLFEDEIAGLLIGENLTRINGIGELNLRASLISYLSLVIGQILHIINMGIGLRNKRAIQNNV